MQTHAAADDDEKLTIAQLAVVADMQSYIEDGQLLGF